MTALQHLNPRILRDLAAAIEARDPANIARGELTREGIEKLADIYLSGSQPTVGFWRRYRRSRPS
jgi:hypothetical protein